MAETKIPNNRDAMIGFYASHQPIWVDNAAALGLDPLTLDPFKTAVDEAIAAQAAATAARNAAKLATDMLNAKAAALRAIGGGVVGTIRGYAELTGNVEIYDIAKLSPPAPPTPAGPPVAPTDLIADPTPNGTIEIAWKGTTAQGQFFIIERRVDGGGGWGPWVRLQPVAAKKFTDEFVPRNSTMIQYQVWGARFDKKSATAPNTTVNFGTVDPEIAAAFRSGNAGSASLAA